jgi:ABC-2 type transport system permease protein
MIKIYFQFKAQYLKTQMEYTVNFWMLVFSGILMRTLAMGVVFVLYRNIPDIAGWKEGELYLILGFTFATEGLCNIFTDGTWNLQRLVFSGEFDTMLIKPVSPLYQILSYEISLQGIGVLAMGIVSIGLGLGLMDMVTPVSILFCAVFLVTGMVLRTSYNLIGACNVFWRGAGGQMNVPYLLYSIGEYAKYPVTIYPGIMRFILLVLIPSGFVGFVPALVIRGENPLLYTLALVVMTCLYFLAARAVFYYGIRKYESMGM